MFLATGEDGSNLTHEPRKDFSKFIVTSCCFLIFVSFYAVLISDTQFPRRRKKRELAAAADDALAKKKRELAAAAEEALAKKKRELAANGAGG